jgi:hypothetical protein
MASQQWRRRLPQPNRNCDAAKSNANGHVNHHTTYNGYTYGHGNHHTTSVSYAYGHTDAVAEPDPASADAKAAAHAVPSADAVSEWAKS